MASFLANTGAGEVLRRTDQRIVGGTVIGPPRTPAANFAVGPGGVSVLPNIPSAGPPIARINPRQNVTLEKNPRISLAYSVRDGNAYTQGDLVAIQGNNDSWTFPELMDMTKFMQRANDVVEAGGDFKEFFMQNRLVGVFATAMESGVDRSAYGTDTVTINAARFCAVRDYWMTNCRAGNNLYLAAIHRKDMIPVGAPAPKRSKNDDVAFYFIRGYDEEDVKDVLTELEDSGEDPWQSAMYVRVGMAQNHIVPVHDVDSKPYQRFESDGEDFGYINHKSSGNATTRLREIHLDHLFFPKFLP